MKHLKKLSVAIMMVTVFSVSFTSCIDNEVSPLVEAIYEAQADLIAAQANVQNAEAALRLAQANAEQAIADATAATSASNSAASAETLRFAIASNDIAIENAQIELETAQLAWEVLMQTQLATLRAAGAVEAAGYLTKYMGYMEDVAEGTASLLGKQSDLAEAELLLTTYTDEDGTHQVTFAYYLAMLNSQLTGLQAKVTGANAKIAGYETAMGNPTAVETQIAAVNAEIADYEDRQQELIVEIANAKFAEAEALTALNAAEAVLDEGGAYLDALGSLEDWEGEYASDAEALAEANETIALLTPQVADYAGTLAALRTAAAAATARIGAKAVFYGSGDLKTAGFGLLGAKEVLENKLYGTNGDNALPDSSEPSASFFKLTGAASAWNAEFYYVGTVKTLTAEAVLWNAEHAYYNYKADFDQLTDSYNLAANALATAQVDFDAEDFDAALTTATTNQNTAQGNVTTDLAAYTAAKTAFEAAPAGSTDVDTDATNYDASILGISSDNVTGAGIDDFTWRRVKTWKDDGTLSDNYVPDTFYPEAYDNGTAFATVKADLIASSALTGAHNTADDYDGKYNVIDGNNIHSYDADGVSGFTGLTSAGVKLAIGFQSATNSDADISEIYFINVESDDTSVSNAYTFNLASNKLGVKITDAFYTTSGGVRTYVGNSTANYDIDYTLNGAGPTYALTTYAKLWNAQKAFSEATYNLTGSGLATTLADAQEEYDIQKELFEAGVTNLDALSATVTAAAAIVGKVKTSTPRSGLLGDIELIDNELGYDEFGTSVVDAGLDEDGLTVENATRNYADASDELPFTLNINDESGDFEYNVDALWSDTEFTAYAELWMARNDVYDTEATDVAGLEGDLADAEAVVIAKTNEMAEDLIFVAYYQAIVDELEAEYEAAVATPENAALEVAYLTAMAATKALEDENDAINSIIGDLEDLISDLSEATITDYAELITEQEDLIIGWNQDIAELEVTIALADNDLATAMNETIEVLKAEIVALQAQIAADQALAAKYKALMDAALAS